MSTTYFSACCPRDLEDNYDNKMFKCNGMVYGPCGAEAVFNSVDPATNQGDLDAMTTKFNQEFVSTNPPLVSDAHRAPYGYDADDVRKLATKIVSSVYQMNADVCVPRNEDRSIQSLDDPDPSTTAKKLNFLPAHPYEGVSYLVNAHGGHWVTHRVSKMRQLDNEQSSHYLIVEVDAHFERVKHTVMTGPDAVQFLFGLMTTSMRTQTVRMSYAKSSSSVESIGKWYVQWNMEEESQPTRKKQRTTSPPLPAPTGVDGTASTYIGCGSLSPFGVYMHAFTRRHEYSTEIQRTKAFIEGTYGFLSGSRSPAYVAHAAEFAEESICNGTFCEALKRGADGTFLSWIDLLVATRRFGLARGV